MTPEAIRKKNLKNKLWRRYTRTRSNYDHTRYKRIKNELKSCFFVHFFISGTEHSREDNPDLYYWGEITGQHTQTFNI